MDSRHEPALNLPSPAAVDSLASDSTTSWRHLDDLESEAIHILREVAAECVNPVLLFSGGEDSTVLLRLAEKAFRPGTFPFPLLHVDTGHNFPEVIAFRDHTVEHLGERLIVRTVPWAALNSRAQMRAATPCKR